MNHFILGFKLEFVLAFRVMEFELAQDDLTLEIMLDQGPNPYLEAAQLLD